MKDSYSKIYLITNIITGMQYVGQSTYRISSRKNAHLNGKTNKILKADIEKYGKDNFTFTELCWCKTRSDVNFCERLLIEQLNTQYPNGYNLHAGGNSKKHHKSTCKLISKLKTGNKNRLGKKATRQQQIDMMKLISNHAPIIAECVKTKRKTYFLTISETSDYGFSRIKVGKCLNKVRTDGLPCIHKNHYFYYANQSGSVISNEISHAQRLEIETKYGITKLNGKPVVAVNLATGEEKVYLNKKACVVDGFNAKCIERVLYNKRPHHKNHFFKYLDYKISTSPEQPK